MPLPSRAISHARGHLRVSRFARRTTEKRETARSLDTNRIRVDGRIRFVYATSGRRYFGIRIKKFADTKISGYEWTGP